MIALLKRGLLFTAMLLGLYFVSLIGLVAAKLDGASMLRRFAGVPIHLSTRAGGSDFSLVRFKEAARHDPVDIVFAGSSHAYRGFDPRIFQEQGWTSFNLGSRAQTPLNSYYLLERYLKNLQPNRVILEIYPRLLDSSGLEAFYAVFINHPIDAGMVRMALATRRFEAVHMFTALGMKRLFDPLENTNQSRFEDDSYIADGYVERHTSADTTKKLDTIHIGDVSRQVSYLEAIAELAHMHGAEMIWVTQPLPAQSIRASPGYRQATALLKKLAAQNGVAYFDFSETLELDPVLHFYDEHHLNSAGVKIFNEALIDSLRVYERF